MKTLDDIKKGGENYMKYKILWDYRSEGHEGHSFHCDNKGNIVEFNTVEEAVKKAIILNYSVPFLIVQIIDWEAKEKPCPTLS